MVLAVAGLMDPAGLSALLSAIKRDARPGPDPHDALRAGMAHGLAGLRALLWGGVSLSAIEAASWAVQGYRIIELNPRALERDCMAALPLALCRQAGAVAVGRDGPTLIVAMADPSDINALDGVRRHTGGAAACEIVVADQESISEAIRRYEATETMGDDPPEPAGFDTPAPVSISGPDHAESQAARVVAAVITYAVNSKASDVHLYCDDRGAEIRIRIDGVLHPYRRFDGTGTAAGIVGRIKVLGGLDLGQRRLPQDGRIQADVAGRSVDLRLATIPNVWGAEDAVLRILDPSIGVVSLGSLGMSIDALSAWARLWQAPYGLVLVAGPTGSGKSTTLYATLREIATPDRAVRSVEDPVEVRIPGITQVQVNPKAGLTFASALRSFLRADPDVIFVGEIRDQETARVATEAAVTGHLVLATVHTASAAQVPVRLVEMGVPAYLVSAALRGAMAQRLVRRLCRECKVRRGPRHGSAWPADAGEAPTEVAEANPSGCPRCANTGYRGRLAAAEVMLVDDPMRQAIAEGVPVENMTRLAIASGLLPLRQAITAVVSEGDTSLAELARVTAAGD